MAGGEEGKEAAAMATAAAAPHECQILLKMSQATRQGSSGHEHLRDICSENAIKQNCVGNSGHPRGAQASNVFKDPAIGCDRGFFPPEREGLKRFPQLGSQHEAVCAVSQHTG